MAKKILAAISALAAIAAIYFVFKDTGFCTISSCIYSKPVLLLGVVFYVAVCFSFFVPVWNRFAIPLLIIGSITHSILLSYDYVATDGLCPVCLAFASVTCVLLAGSLWLEKQFWPSISAAMIAAAALVLAGAGTLMPVASAVPHQSVPADQPANVVVQETMPVSDPARTAEKPAKETARTQLDRNEENPAQRKAGQPVSGSDGKPHTELADISDKPSTPVEKPVEMKPVTMTVQDVHGNHAVLDITRRPALLFAPSCPACHEVLARISHQKELPYLVGVWYSPGKHNEIADILVQEGLSNTDYFVMPDPSVKAVPALMYNGGGQVKSVSGSVKVKKLLGELMRY
ncbi:MAG: hypothetical protein K6T65_09020 [Peptococcaceae bacterium]|nr:hypothetical protein [Peptococcaceae bacterium]